MLQTNILFVDARNNGRSILAEAYFNQTYSGAAVRAFSAGVRPDKALDPVIFDALRGRGIRPDDYQPKAIEIFHQPYSPRIDLIVGFKPLIEAFHLPIFTNHPPVSYLRVEPIQNRVKTCSRGNAVRDCFKDIALAVDHAMVNGEFSHYQAA